MPRGTRAIHGAEVTGPHHAHATADLEMVQALYDYLPTLCWCERVAVVVPQREVCRGTTRSCGRPSCAPPHQPEGTAVLVGAVCGKRYGPGFTVAQAVALFGDSLHGRRDVLRRRATVRTVRSQRRGRALSPSIAARRDRVAAKWNAGLPLRLIAEALDIPMHTVASDVAAMQRDGMIEYRYECHSRTRR